MLLLRFPNLSLLIIDAYPFGSIITDVTELRECINEILRSGDEIVMIEDMFPDADDSNVGEVATLWLVDMECRLNKPIPFITNTSSPTDFRPMQFVDTIIAGRDSLQDIDLS